MSPLFNKFQLLMSPEGPLGNGGSGSLGAQDLLTELMKDDDETPEVIDLDTKKEKTPEVKEEKEDEEELLDDKGEKKDKKEKDDEDEDDEDEEEVDELAELEAELEGPDDKQLELMTPARRKDILTKYPKLFKDFPYLETAYYRDQKFTEVFPTIKEAEEAASQLQQFGDFQAKLKTGDIEQVITDIKKDDKAFFKMVDNYLPTLAKVAPEAYHHIVGNLIKYTVQEMFGEANVKNNDSLKNAATILHDFIFGTTKWTPPQMLSQNTKPENRQAEDDLQQRERAFAERKFNTAQNEIASKVDNAIKATIDMHIDPNKQMTDFVKNAAVQQALASVEQLISKDTRFKTLLDRLWQNAAEKDFAKAEMDKIKSACVSKARTLLPSVIKTARHNALKGMGKRSKQEEVETEQDTTTQPEKRGSAPQSRGQKVDKSKPQAGESSLDFLMRD